uniref:Uncharacterized protein n=1 Tax=Arundo donax TaxID=35708 RepID=A0A0A9E730_ARUDO
MSQNSMPLISERVNRLATLADHFKEAAAHRAAEGRRREEENDERSRSSSSRGQLSPTRNSRHLKEDADHRRMTIRPPVKTRQGVMQAKKGRRRPMFCHGGSV